MRIAVLIDGSPNTPHLLSAASRFAIRRDTILILHAISPPHHLAFNVQPHLVVEEPDAAEAVGRAPKDVEFGAGRRMAGGEKGEVEHERWEQGVALVKSLSRRGVESREEREKKAAEGARVLEDARVMLDSLKEIRASLRDVTISTHLLIDPSPRAAVAAFLNAAEPPFDAVFLGAHGGPVHKLLHPAAGAFGRYVAHHVDASLKVVDVAKFERMGGVDGHKRIVAGAEGKEAQAA